MIKAWLLAISLASSGSEVPDSVKIFYDYDACQGALKARPRQAFRRTDCTLLSLHASSAYASLDAVPAELHRTASRGKKSFPLVPPVR